MSLDPDACYRALQARDARFDGVFFVGVASTGIYCRPICPARTPGRNRCTFYSGAAQAEGAGFRPCLRCRPELAPGLAAVDSVPDLVRRAVAEIEAGFLDHHPVDELAVRLGVSARHLRRATEQELGVSPVQLAQTQRLALAHQLVSHTDLPLATVAHAAGFGSVRRFNAAFRRRFDRPPSAVRRGRSKAPRNRAELTVRVGYRAPLPVGPLLAFLAPRAIPGVEHVGTDHYVRSVCDGERHGWIEVRFDERRAVAIVRVDLPLAPALPSIVAGVRRLFDLNARPDLIDAHLRRHAPLRALVARRPGLRVPGAFEGFEIAVRAILGQQVTVKGATTLAGRLVQRFGQPLPTPREHVTHRFPNAATLARVPALRLAQIGLPRARAEALVALARAVDSGEVELLPNAASAPQAAIEGLCRLPGIGPWTAHYVAMRALGWPDAFPASDLGIRKALGVRTPPQARAKASGWAPWRAYAVMHLWTSLGDTT